MKQITHLYVLENTGYAPQMCATIQNLYSEQAISEGSKSHSFKVKSISPFSGSNFNCSFLFQDDILKEKKNEAKNVEHVVYPDLEHETQTF